MISIRTPQRASTAPTSSAPFAAARSQAVPTAAISAAPARLASSAMPAIASIVRLIGSGSRVAAASRPSPRRVTSARSATVFHVPSARRSPTWSLTEFVPTSIAANRFAPKPRSVFRPRAMQTFVREERPSERTAATTRAGSSDSTAIVRVAPLSVRTSLSSAMQPPTV